MKKKIYTVINDKFSRDDYSATAAEIIENVIECNESWETEYEENDFIVTDDEIIIDGEILAIAKK